MKTFGLLILLFLFPLISISQEYSFPLYFEDSLGNKDTLFFGFDQSASFGIDEKFGELNIKGEPYDSAFHTFFTDAATNEEYDCRLETEKNPTYLTKKQYINLWNDQFIEIGLIAKNWPIKISWNQNAIADFDIDKYIGNKDYGLLLTSWRPLNGYPESFCCGEWPAPEGLTWLLKATDIQIEKNNCCLYKANSSKDTISLIYIGRMYKYTSVKDFQTEMYRCWYNVFLNAVSIQNINGLMSTKLEVFNIWGLKVMDEQIFSSNETQINLNISHLPNGLYLARLSTLKNNSLSYTFKIIKR